MGKVNNALRMLAILRSRGKVTRAEIAEELEVDIRQVTRYKEDLEYAGVHIDNIKGKYGGYELKNKDYLLNLELTKEEERALNETSNFYKAQNSFLVKDIESIIDKINIIKHTVSDEENEAYLLKTKKIRGNVVNERDKWLKVNDAVINKRKLSIYYEDARGDKCSRIIHPLGIYTCEGANYCIAYCEKREAIRNFKMLRVSKLQLLDERFQYDNFNLKEYLKNTIGVTADKEYDLVLKFN